MSRFDEEPDGDPHGECALEIARLKALHHDCANQLRIALRERDEALALAKSYVSDAGRYRLIRGELSMEPGFTMQGKRVVMAWWPGIKINSSANEDVDVAIDAALK